MLLGLPLSSDHVLWGRFLPSCPFQSWSVLYGAVHITVMCAHVADHMLTTEDYIGITVILELTGAGHITAPIAEM